MRTLEERLNKVLIDWLGETNNSPSFGKFMKVSKYNLETRNDAYRDWETNL